MEYIVCEAQFSDSVDSIWVSRNESIKGGGREQVRNEAKGAKPGSEARRNCHHAQDLFGRVGGENSFYTLSETSLVKGEMEIAQTSKFVFIPSSSSSSKGSTINGSRPAVRMLCCRCLKSKVQMLIQGKED